MGLTVSNAVGARKGAIFQQGQEASLPCPNLASFFSPLFHFFFFFFFNFSYPSFLILFFMLPLLSIFSTLEAFSLPTLIIPTPTPQDRCIYRPSLLLLHTSNALLSPVLSNCFSFLLPLLVSTFYAWIMR